MSETKVCPCCNGNGLSGCITVCKDGDDYYKDCPTCNGEGEVRSKNADCEEAGFHRFETKERDGKFDIDLLNIMDGYEEVDIEMTCSHCGAVASVSGFFNNEDAD